MSKASTLCLHPVLYVHISVLVAHGQLAARPRRSKTIHLLLFIARTLRAHTYTYTYTYTHTPRLTYLHHLEDPSAGNTLFSSFSFPTLEGGSQRQL